jgi:hypothetical protein
MTLLFLLFLSLLPISHPLPLSKIHHKTKQKQPDRYTFEAMSKFMKTRTPIQIGAYYQRNKKKLIADSKKYKLRQHDHEKKDTNKNKSKKNVDHNEEMKKEEVVVEDEKEEEDMVEQYGRHYWTRGEQEKLAEAFTVYGNNDNNKYCNNYFNNLSKFMKYRRGGALRGYMQRHADKIKKLSKKYKSSSKPTIRTAATPWTDEEHGKLCEGYALYKNDYGTIEGYIRNRSATQIESMLIKNADQFNDESDFNIGSGLTQPVELYHVLNIAPHEGFDHIISWNWQEESNCRSFKIHDKGMFLVFSLLLFFLLEIDDAATAFSSSCSF